MWNKIEIVLLLLLVLFSGGEIGVPRSLETRSPGVQRLEGPQTKKADMVKYEQRAADAIRKI